MTDLLLRHKRAGDWEAATATLWWAAEQHAPTLRALHANMVLSTLAAAKPTAEWERACALLEQMPSMGLRRDPYSYSSTIAACSRAGQPECALTIFRQCSAEAEEDVRPNGVIFNAMLLACQRAGPTWQPQLLAIFTAMGTHGVTPDAWAYSVALNAHAQTRQWRKALELLDVMELRSVRDPAGARPDSHCYGAAMRACLQSSEPERVAALHERMVAAGVPRSAYTLVPLLDSHAAVARKGDHAAWRPAKAALDAAAAEDMALNVLCYSAAARAYAECGRYEEALQLLPAMRARQPPVLPNAHVFTAIISSFGPSRQSQRALTLLRGMRERGVAVDAHCVEAALKVVGRAGAWRDACALLRTMRVQLGVSPTPIHLTTALQCVGAAGEWDEAAALLEDVLGRHALAVDARLAEAALRVCAHSGSWQRALALLDDAGNTATPPMRRAAALALGRAGEWRRAQELLDRLAAVDGDAGRRDPAMVKLAALVAEKVANDADAYA